jgi:hypothetical protein
MIWAAPEHDRKILSAQNLLMRDRGFVNTSFAGSI